MVISFTEFMRILQSQSSKVDDMYESGQAANELVKQTEKEMQLTIDRSQSYQWNMVILSVTLAVMLLVLDWITP